MGNLIEKAFEKWYRFYKLINNKESFNESESIVAALRIKGALEEYLNNREDLRDILEAKGISDNGISDRRISYVANDRMYIDSRIDLEKGIRSNAQYNEYIFNYVKTIVFENIDIYFEYCENILEESEVENIKSTALEFTENKNLVKKTLKLLYLFANSERENTRKKDIEDFIKFSIVNMDDYFSTESIAKTLVELEKKEMIHIDWAGSYSIISEAKKRFSKVLDMKYKEVTVEERNIYISDIIKEKLQMIIEYIGDDNLNINIDIDGNKIYQANSDFILKIDNYTKENRDIRRGYYVLNTKQYKNILFWYGKRILDLEDRIKYVIAEGRTINALQNEWKIDEKKIGFIKEKKEHYERILSEIKSDVENGFKNGGCIYRGEDKKIVYNDSIVDLFKQLLKIFE